MSGTATAVLKTKWRRARSKRPGALLRVLLLRVWPFSVLTQAYYAARFTPFVWTRVLNRKCRVAFGRHPAALDGVQQCVADELGTRGIAITHLDEIVGTEALPRLQAEARGLLSRPAMSSQIRERRSQFGGKDYVIRAFGDGCTVDTNNALVAFALNERVLEVVSAYLGMCPRLKYMDLWYNLPVDPSAPEISSQRWHRDYDDYRMVKLFLYLEDVDAQTGPFMYIPETQAGARYGHVYPSKPPSGSYPPGGAIERVLGASRAVVCTGRAGTLVLADTAGFHKGGRAIAGARLLFTATYASDASVEQDRYRLSPRSDYSTLGPLARFALRTERRL